MHYFSLFFNGILKPSVNFCGFGRKIQIVGKFWNFFKVSWENSKNALFEHIFQLNFKKPALIFCVFGQNTNCWDILRNFWKFLIQIQYKIEFLTSFAKFVAKNRAFGNNIIFLQQSFPISGGRSACSPLAKPLQVHRCSWFGPLSLTRGDQFGGLTISSGRSQPLILQIALFWVLFVLSENLFDCLIFPYTALESSRVFPLPIFSCFGMFFATLLIATMWNVNFYSKISAIYHFTF